MITGCVYVCYAEQLCYTQISPMEIKETVAPFGMTKSAI